MRIDFVHIPVIDQHGPQKRFFGYFVMGQRLVKINRQRHFYSEAGSFFSLRSSDSLSRSTSILISASTSLNNFILPV